MLITSSLNIMLFVLVYVSVFPSGDIAKAVDFTEALLLK